MITFTFLPGFVSTLILVLGASLVSAIPTVRVHLLDVDIDNDKLVEVHPDNGTEQLYSSTDRSRQDGDDVGENVVQIISGVLGGGLGNIFEGSSNFIGDTGVQSELQTVFKNVAPPLDVIFKYGFDGLKQYFGIGVTTPKTTLNGTQASTLVPQQGGQVPQVQQQQLQGGAAVGGVGGGVVSQSQPQLQQQIQQQPQQQPPQYQQQQPPSVYATYPPPSVTTTEDGDNENDPDGDSDIGHVAAVKT